MDSELSAARSAHVKKASGMIAKVSLGSQFRSQVRIVYGCTKGFVSYGGFPHAYNTNPDNRRRFSLHTAGFPSHALSV